MTTPSTDFRRNVADERANFYTEGKKNFQNESSLKISISSGHEVSSSSSVQTSLTTSSTKPHMVPLAYFQTPTSVSKPNTNVVLNTMQLSNLSQNGTNISNKKSVILTKPQQIVMQKTTGSSLVPISAPSHNSNLKNTVALLTMIKPVAKPSEANRVQLNPIRSDNIQIIPNMANINSNSGQKYLLTPMPKISSNRLPVTATTNCNLQSKIAFMPLQVPNTVKGEKPKMINFKITNGIASEPISVVSPDQVDDKIDNSLLCTETLSSSPEKNKEQEDKTYQLSIVEDSSSRNENSYTITIPDEKGGEKDQKFKQGISILKKSFTLERKPVIVAPKNHTSVIIENIPQQAQLTSFENDENFLSTPVISKSKPGRRRKSNFAYRKDYDEIEFEEKEKVTVQSDANAFTKFLEAELEAVKSSQEKMEAQEMKKCDEYDYNFKEADENDNFEWENGVGTLPGTNLKFEVNEFGTLELLSEEELKKYNPKPKEKIRVIQEHLCCIECGCYGLPSDFISSRHCSVACQEATEQSNRYKKKRKRGNWYKNERDSSDEDNISNENSQDKVYPWNCSKKGFSWAKYLEHTKGKGAPVKLFKDPFPYTRNGFRVGMKLEGIDPLHPKYFCVLTVNEVLGFRIRLHFDGYPENYDFWRNADSLDIFPIGWCEKNGHTLHPPPNFEPDEFNWANYLKYTKSTAAPKQLFPSRLPNHCPNAFRVGMKLEAVDKNDSTLVCVATIADMMDNRILVHFDSWDDIYDYWAEPTSPYIHPVGWCDQYGHNLTPPNDYPNPKAFTWESYLRETKSVAAPVRAFKQRPTNGFKAGMKLECVDKRVPHLIRVSTVSAVRDHQIRIQFDGWPDKYSYWVDDDCSDIHPMGWCHKTSHPLEPPLTPDDVYDFLECATVGCRGQGHIEGPKYAVHTSTKYCPYADENIDLEKTLPDRLLSPDREIETVIPVSREPKENVKIRRVGRPPKIPRIEVPPKPKSESEDDEDDNDEDDDDDMEEEEDMEVQPKRKLKEDSPISNDKRERMSSPNGYSTPLNNGKASKISPVWEKHCQYLKQYVNVHSNPKNWSVHDVISFVQSIPSCRNQGETFLCNRIDGDSLLMLTQDDIVSVLNVKIGPAVKLYNSILLLRQNILREFT